MLNKLLKILMVDDDPEDLEFMGEAILQVDQTVELHKFLNGRSVIEFINLMADDDLPCLIILDYHMPILNGAETLSLIMSDKRLIHIPKAVLSTSMANLNTQDNTNHGTTAYFVKPALMSEFILLAKRILALCKPTFNKGQ